ncbi:MAG: ribonuclease H-like domain-containing protein [Bacillota bacterium]|nr:ribonuclease H-like domain-containing protein [Bacillota bacterium]
MKIQDSSFEYSLEAHGNKEIYKDAIFFDLEHYVYKKPICVGVFGCCYYDDELKELKVTQYMIENKDDAVDILFLIKSYMQEVYSKYNKKYVVTFSGNNDFTMINYLFKKYSLNYNLKDYLEEIDLQKEYEKVKKSGIGLKALEKEFNIVRDSEVISGSNLAKTFSKIVKDKDYFLRMPKDKINKILLYNEQDVVSLFYILVNWNNVIKEDEKTSCE